jgi:hypothetical protein
MRVKSETCEGSPVRHPQQPDRQMRVCADPQTRAPMPPQADAPWVPHDASRDRRDGRLISPGTEGSDSHTAALTTRVPAMLTVDEVALLLRTSKKAGTRWSNAINRRASSVWADGCSSARRLW